MALWSYIPAVVPAKARLEFPAARRALLTKLDSRLRGNDGVAGDGRGASATVPAGGIDRSPGGAAARLCP